MLMVLGGAAASPLCAHAQQAPGETGTTGFDPRLTPARSDLAARHLAGSVDAKRFADGETYEVASACAPLRRQPADDAELMTEALEGERLTVYDTTEDGWAWGQLAADGYVGFLPARTLRAPGPQPTHKVSALRTFVFPAPSIKLPPLETLSFGAQLAVAQVEGSFAVTVTGGYVSLLHVAPLATMENDFVGVAERFLGTPYLWGGKTSVGLDCSALVQLALTACGVSCLRDTDMQERTIGGALDPQQALQKLQRGDLIFWKGHVAIARDARTLVHANASRHMAVAFEDAGEAVARIAATGSEISSVRRLPFRS
ncbi:MAG: C40 family peptidase [Xanthobacteraceae bacterium]